MYAFSGVERWRVPHPRHVQTRLSVWDEIKEVHVNKNRRVPSSHNYVAELLFGYPTAFDMEQAGEPSDSVIKIEDISKSTLFWTLTGPGTAFPSRRWSFCDDDEIPAAAILACLLNETAAMALVGKWRFYDRTAIASEVFKQPSNSKTPDLVYEHRIWSERTRQRYLSSSYFWRYLGAHGEIDLPNKHAKLLPARVLLTCPDFSINDSTVTLRKDEQCPLLIIIDTLESWLYMGLTKDWKKHWRVPQSGCDVRPSDHCQISLRDFKTPQDLRKRGFDLDTYLTEEDRRFLLTHRYSSWTALNKAFSDMITDKHYSSLSMDKTEIFKPFDLIPPDVLAEAVSLSTPASQSSTPIEECLEAFEVAMEKFQVIDIPKREPDEVQE